METYVLHVTKQCNLDCLYCYEQDKTSTYSWDEIKSFIDELLANRTSDIFNIEFLGGEPMLAFHHIKRAYNYMESIQDITVNGYFITTNGTILPDDLTAFLKSNKKVIFAISMDGTKTANQLRVFKESRLNSYEAVAKTIRMLTADGIEPTVHIVTHPYNIESAVLSAIDLYNQGVRCIDYGIVESTIKIDKEFGERYIEKLKEISDMIISGELPDLFVGVLNSLKPVTDVRTYIKDKETGKLIAESYGRSGNDVSNTTKYEVVRVQNKSDETKIIEHCRAEVFAYHKKNIKSIKERI